MRALRLAEVRELMFAANIPTLPPGPAGLAIARKRANEHDIFLRNMILALSIHYWSNTREDWQRLEAAIVLHNAKRSNKR